MLINGKVEKVESGKRKTENEEIIQITDARRCPEHFPLSTFRFPFIPQFPSGE